MSSTCYYANTLVRGSKETIVRILNAVICNTGGSERIHIDDDIETINHKVNEEDGYAGLMFIYRHDLLDKDMVLDPKIQMHRNALRKEGFYTEDGYIPEKGTHLNAVTTYGTEFAIEFLESEMENDPYIDWVDWEDICRLYGSTIFSDLYDTDQVGEYQHTDLYEKVGDDEVETTHFSHDQQFWRLYDCFDALIEIDPDRYRPLKINTLQMIEDDIHNLIIREKLKITNSPCEPKDEPISCEKSADDDDWIINNFKRYDTISRK